MQGDTNPNVGGIVGDCRATRMLVLPQKSGLTGDEYAVGIAEYFDDVSALLITKFPTVPSATPQKIRYGGSALACAVLQTSGLASDRGPHPIQKSVTCLPQLRRYLRRIVAHRNHSSREYPKWPVN
jgi:hypothetical protein